MVQAGCDPPPLDQPGLFPPPAPSPPPGGGGLTRGWPGVQQGVPALRLASLQSHPAASAFLRFLSLIFSLWFLSLCTSLLRKLGRSQQGASSSSLAAETTAPSHPPLAPCVSPSSSWDGPRGSGSPPCSTPLGLTQGYPDAHSSLLFGRYMELFFPLDTEFAPHLHCSGNKCPSP